MWIYFQKWIKRGKLIMGNFWKRSKLLRSKWSFFKYVYLFALRKSFNFLRRVHLLRILFIFRITRYSRNLWTAIAVARIWQLFTRVGDIISFIAKSAMLKCLSGRILSWGKLSKIDIFMEKSYVALSYLLIWYTPSSPHLQKCVNNTTMLWAG